MANIDDIFSMAQQKALKEKKTGKKRKKTDSQTENEQRSRKIEYPSLVDVISFAESGSFLQGIELYPWQRIILKALYMKTHGNEELEFTEEEWELMERDLDEDNFESIKDKFKDCNSLPIRDELVLCLGRRSFKSFLTSIIALYETYKLLCQDCPQEKYGIDRLKPIWVINVATNQEQAKIVFDEMEAKIRSCDFFTSRLGKCRMGEMHFLTNADMEMNDKLAENPNLPMVEGSVVLTSGNSNSAGLRGHAAIVVIYDEIAHFVDSSGKHSDHSIYTALQPSLQTFNWIDENGKKHRDGKSVLISSPTTRNRVFYNRYIRALDKNSGGIAFKLPTWKANPNIDKEDLAEAYQSDPDAFMQEYAAEFSYGGTEAFFTPQMIDRCVERGMKRNLNNEPVSNFGVRYFMHVDPAKTGDNYALVVVHAEDAILENGEPAQRIVMDHAKVWVPVPDDNISMKNAVEILADEDQYNILEVVEGKINPMVVDEYVEYIANIFNFSSITYDHWESASSITRLKSRNLPVSVLTFAGKSKTSYYGHLYSLVSNDLLDIIPSPIIADELKFLQKKRTRGGWTVDKLDKEHMDDIADCLAAACFVASSSDAHNIPLPKARTIRTGWI